MFNCHEFTPALLRVPARAVAVAGLAFRGAFALGAVCALAGAVIAVFLVPAVLRGTTDERPAH